MPGSKASRGIQQNIRPLNLKSNVGGMVQNKAESFIPITQAVDIQNMHQINQGSWSADFAGYGIINAGGTPYESGAAIDNLMWFIDNLGADHLLFAANGKLKEANIATGVATDVDAAAGFTPGARVSSQELGYSLFTCDGNIAKPRKWTGSVAGNSGGWPVSDGTNTYTTPRFVQKHNDRLLYVVGDSYVIISDLQSGESFTQPATTAAHSYIAQIGIGDGQKIRAARSINVPGKNETQCVIFKDRSIWTITGKSALQTDTDVFHPIPVNLKFGAFNDQSVIEVGQDLIFFNETGVYSYSTANTSGTLQPLAIPSDMVKGTFGTLNKTYKSQCWAQHLPNRREIWFFMPTGSSTQCDTALVYKYPDPTDPTTVPVWSKRTSAGVFKPGCGVLFNSAFYVGFSTGKIGLMFNSSQYDSVGIPYVYEYPNYDAGNEKQIKSLKAGEAQFKIRSNQTAALTCHWKGGNNNDVSVNTLAINTTVAGTTWGSQSFGNFYYGGLDEVKVEYFAFGDGLKLKHILSGTTNTTGPEFLGLIPILEYGSLSQDWN